MLVCLFTCCCSWYHMFHVAACARIIRHSVSVWAKTLRCQIIAYGGAVWLLLFYSRKRKRGFHVLWENKWVIREQEHLKPTRFFPQTHLLLSGMFYESWSKFLLTSCLLRHPLQRLKIRACTWLWCKKAVVFCLHKVCSCNAFLLSPLIPLCRIGLLLLGKPLDRESTDQYRLIVTASDGNPGGVRYSSLLNYWNDIITADKHLTFT